MKCLLYVDAYEHCENPSSALKRFQTSVPITSRLMIICYFKQEHVFLAVTTSEQT